MTYGLVSLMTATFLGLRSNSFHKTFLLRIYSFALPPPQKFAFLFIHSRLFQQSRGFKNLELGEEQNLLSPTFYKFLIDGGLRSALHPQFWKTEFPVKFLFCQLASEEKILTLVNLANKGCNSQNVTGTCVLCYKGSKTTDHLLLRCEVQERIWELFKQTLNIHSQAQSLSKILGSHPQMIRNKNCGA